MASGGGGGGCACPGQSKLSSIASTKHAVRTVPAILLGGERGERGRVAAGTRAVPGRGKPGKTWPEEERETCRATLQLQKFPRSYLGAGRGREPLAAQAGRGRLGRGGARRDRAGRGEARPTARPGGGGERAGAGRGAAGTAGAPRRGDRRGVERGGRGARAIASGSTAPLPARRRSTQGALAQLLQRGCRLGRSDWLPSSRPL